ncbi:hypothetical protein MNB_SV-15-820 [hydrothermal vent metagenome]|uniref:HNH nuclease domain-containing protein n=1 Tax=hydrothermal vent metagenome TaxID=652676 RepID=A0A1W1EJQ9_9ZZZZ
MNLNFEKFESFLKAVENIIGSKVKEARKLLESKGKDIENISDIFISENDELFDLLPDGSLVKVNLYIATKNVDAYTMNRLTKKDLYKYHIYKCSTITQMFNAERKHRYKINKRDDGKFFFIFNDYRGNILKKSENQELNICKNCLAKFLHKYVSDNDVENFNLQDFHNQNSNLFDFDTSSLEKGEDAKPNVYSQRWNRISTQFKIKKDYTCEACNWKAQNQYQQRFIHTHHQNGDKTNNRDENLKALCIKCHSEVDVFHSRIKKQDSYKEFMELQ